MKRVLCLWLPNWPIQRLWWQQPELRERPVVLSGQGTRRREVVVACCPQAHAQGIRCGMPLAEARAFVTMKPQSGGALCTLSSTPDVDVAALRRLAWACETYSPLVGLEASPRPECLLLDITGCEALFCGEENLARQFHQQVEQWGLQGRMAIAGTIGLAWGMAHTLKAAESPCLISLEQAARQLSRLPIDALRLSPERVNQLHRLGIRSVGQLQALPRQSLPARFGTELTERLDEAAGRRQELIVPERRPEPLETLWESDTPLHDESRLSTLLTRLLEGLLDKLQVTGEGLQHLVCRLTEVNRRTHTLSLEMLRPTKDIDYVLDLLRLQWERLTLGDGLVCLQVQCVKTSLIALRQQDLLSGGRFAEATRHFEQLQERLSSRLGRQAVLKPQLLPESLPERAVRFVPCLGESPLPSVGEEDAAYRPPRPLWLKSPPVCVEGLSTISTGPLCQFRWQGRGYRIAQAWGPERITAGWWHDRQVRRDYYLAEADSGQRFWLYRDLTDQRWYLHAEID